MYYLQRLAPAQALDLDDINKGNFNGSLDLDATANEIDNGTDDGLLDFNGTMLPSEPSMMPTSNLT
jgi:hypothetical protein